MEVAMGSMSFGHGPAAHAHEAEESPRPQPSTPWPECALCLSHEPLTGPIPSNDHLTWFECENCQGLVHAWCLGMYGNAVAPEHFQCPRCVAVALTEAPSGPPKLGDLVWARQSPSASCWPAYVAAPPPENEAPDEAHYFVVYYGLDRRGFLTAQAAYVLRGEVCRFTLDAAKVFPGRKKDRLKLADVLHLLFPKTALPTPLPAGSARPSSTHSHNSKRPPARGPCSPEAKRPKAAVEAAPAQPSPYPASTALTPDGFVAAVGCQEGPDLDAGVQRLLQGAGLAEYAPVFQQHRITADLLMSLSGSDLLEMGIVALGDRMRILQAIKEVPA